MKDKNMNLLSTLVNNIRSITCKCDSAVTIDLVGTRANLVELLNAIQSISDAIYSSKLENCNREAILLVRQADSCVSSAEEAVRRSIQIAQCSEDNYDLYGVEVDLCKVYLRKSVVLLCNAKEWV